MDAETVKQIAALITLPKVLQLDDEHQIALLPPDFRVEDITKHLPPPERIQQRVTLLTPEDFSAYLIAYAGAGQRLAVFCDEPAARYEAVLDYHHADDTAAVHRETRGPCDHVAAYACPLSIQWKTWKENSGKPMAQVQFARFIEENMPDVYKPPAADMLQIALQLQVHKSAKFDSDVRLDNGQRQLSYMEEVKGNTKAGNLEIPELFSLKLPVFVDGAPAFMDARLRYRMNDGDLTMWYDLVRPEDVLGAAVKVVTDKIRTALKEKTPAAKVLIGRRGG